MLHPMADPEKSQIAQRVAVVLPVAAVVQGFCHCLHPIFFNFQIANLAHRDEGKEEENVLMVLAWFLLLRRLLPAIQSKMVSSAWDNLPLQVRQHKRGKRTKNPHPSIHAGSNF